MPFLFEFYGEFNDINLFDGEFDEKSLKLHFNHFYLQGVLEENGYTLVENKKQLKNDIQLVLFKDDQRYKM